MRQYNHKLPLIFIHTPKTGGTSTEFLFRKWFRGSFHRHYFNEITGEMPERIDLQSTRSTVPPLIYGHFNRSRNFGVEDYYPAVDQFITILRDPLDMMISSYFYTREQGSNWKSYKEIYDLDLETYIQETEVNMLNHFPRSVSKENYKEIIEEFFVYIGITEDMNSSMINIATCLGRKPPRSTPRENQTSRLSKVSRSSEEIFREKHELEFLVYEHAKDLHQKFSNSRGGFITFIKNKFSR